MDVFNAKFILTEKRYSWIDYDKGISIILVSYGHCLSIIQFTGTSFTNYPFFTYPALFLYGFRMPLFFIISGVFIASGLSRKGFSGYTRGRMNTILYPLFIWGIIEVSWQLFGSYIKHKPASLTDYLFLIIDPRRLGTGHFWYLNALFTIGLLYAALKWFLKIKPAAQLAFGLVLYTISAYIHTNQLEAGILTDICEYYFFFALGDFLSSTLLNELNAKKFASWTVFFPLVILFVAVQYYVTNINLRQGAGAVNYTEHAYPFLFLIEALAGCTLSVNVSFLLQKYRGARFLRVVGYHSLFIYVTQIIIMLITGTLLMRVLKISSVPVLIFTIWFAGVVIPMLFYNICLRTNLWWLFSFKKPEKEIEATKPVKVVPPLVVNS